MIMLLITVMLCLCCAELADENKADSGIHEDFSGKWLGESDEERAVNWIPERINALPIDLIIIVLILLLLSTIYSTVSSFAPGYLAFSIGTK